MGNKSKLGPPRQKLYDAVAKLKTSPVAWVTLNGHRLCLTPVDETDTGLHIVRSRQGMSLAYVVDYKAYSVRDDGVVDRFIRRLQPHDLLAVVSERHKL